MLITKRLQQAIFLLFAIGLLHAACENGASEPPNETDNDSSPIEDDFTMQDTSDWQTYKNETYQIAFSFPQNWQVVENQQFGENRLAISVYPADKATQIELPLSVHEDATLPYLVIYPKGLGTEYPSGKSKSFQNTKNMPLDLTFDPAPSDSRLFQLENEAVWAYMLYPQSTPGEWSEEGYIFTQYAVDNFEAACFDDQSGEIKPLEECDPMGGDRFARMGKIDTTSKRTVRTILANIQLGGVEKNQASENIQLSQPLPNIDVRSPLTVKGEVRGYWFFEGTFPIALYDADDNLLARTTAEAQGKWMTEDFVPFEATLEFDAPDDERGELVLERANPSGQPKNAARYSHLVIFPPTE